MSNYLGSMCETCLEEGNKFNPRLPDSHIQNEGLQFVGSLYIFKRVFGSLKHLCVSRGWEDTLSDTSQCDALVIELFMHSAPALVSQWSKDVAPCSACCKGEQGGEVVNKQDTNQI